MNDVLLGHNDVIIKLINEWSATRPKVIIDSEIISKCKCRPTRPRSNGINYQIVGEIHFEIWKFILILFFFCKTLNTLYYKIEKIMQMIFATKIKDRQISVIVIGLKGKEESALVTEIWRHAD